MGLFGQQSKAKYYLLTRAGRKQIEKKPRMGTDECNPSEVPKSAEKPA